jgi:hypothetical protein
MAFTSTVQALPSRDYALHDPAGQWAAQLSDAAFATKAIQDDPNLLFGWVMLAGGPLDIFGDLLAGAFAFSSCLSHLPLLIGYDEPTTLSYQIPLFGPISADVRQFRGFCA